MRLFKTIEHIPFESKATHQKENNKLFEVRETKSIGIIVVWVNNLNTSIHKRKKVVRFCVQQWCQVNIYQILVKYINKH